MATTGNSSNEIFTPEDERIPTYGYRYLKKIADTGNDAEDYILLFPETISENVIYVNKEKELNTVAQALNYILSANFNGGSSGSIKNNNGLEFIESIVGADSIIIDKTLYTEFLVEIIYADMVITSIIRSDTVGNIVLGNTILNATVNSTDDTFTFKTCTVNGTNVLGNAILIIHGRGSEINNNGLEFIELVIGGDPVIVDKTLYTEFLIEIAYDDTVITGTVRPDTVGNIILGNTILSAVVNSTDELFTLESCITNGIDILENAVLIISGRGV